MKSEAPKGAFFRLYVNLRMGALVLRDELRIVPRQSLGDLEPEAK